MQGFMLVKRWIFYTKESEFMFIFMLYLFYPCWHWQCKNAVNSNPIIFQKWFQWKESLTLVLTPTKVNSWLWILLTILIEINGVFGGVGVSQTIMLPTSPSNREFHLFYFCVRMFNVNASLLRVSASVYNSLFLKQFPFLALSEDKEF